MQKSLQYRVRRTKSLFYESEVIQKLSTQGNPLETLSSVIDFEMFRSILEDAVINKEVKSNAGRRPIDVVQMFKVLVVERLYNLSDESCQYQILDRLSFQRFLGIDSVSDVPDARTIWAFRDKLVKQGVFDRLFDLFRSILDGCGLRYTEGKIVDASFVEAPRQHNTREENKIIKQGDGSSLWQDEEGDDETVLSKKKHKRSHKDIEARWTKKGGQRHYGYKKHIKVDVKTKLIESYVTTSASVHDAKVVSALLEKSDEGQSLYADSGYTGKDEEIKNAGMHPVICERGKRNHPLTDEQKANNRLKSKIRCRVEHVFGFCRGAMHGLKVRSVGFIRAHGFVAFSALLYNMFRFAIIGQTSPHLIRCKG